MTVAPALVAVLTTARMTAFRPGASPPPVRTPIFRMVGMRREVGSATARIADVTARARAGIRGVRGRRRPQRFGAGRFRNGRGRGESWSDVPTWDAWKI